MDRCGAGGQSQPAGVSHGGKVGQSQQGEGRRADEDAPEDGQALQEAFQKMEHQAHDDDQAGRKQHDHGLSVGMDGCAAHKHGVRMGESPTDQHQNHADHPVREEPGYEAHDFEQAEKEEQQSAENHAAADGFRPVLPGRQKPRGAPGRALQQGRRCPQKVWATAVAPDQTIMR